LLLCCLCSLLDCCSEGQSGCVRSRGEDSSRVFSSTPTTPVRSLRSVGSVVELRSVWSNCWQCLREITFVDGWSSGVAIGRVWSKRWSGETFVTSCVRGGHCEYPSGRRMVSLMNSEQG
jgi:hypothetical protein